MRENNKSNVCWNISATTYDTITKAHRHTHTNTYFRVLGFGGLQLESQVVGTLEIGQREARGVLYSGNETSDHSQQHHRPSKQPRYVAPVAGAALGGYFVLGLRDALPVRSRAAPRAATHFAPRSMPTQH